MQHITGIKTAAGIELQEVWDFGGVVTSEADPTLIPMVQFYKHFDLTDEQLGRTSRYNCWGFTFLPRRYWINSSDDVDQIIHDNCIPVAPGSLRPGDVIRYRDNQGVTTHTGRVWQVDAAKNCVKVRSKWGGWAEYVHAPDDPHIFTDAVYGTHLAYFRQVAPLKGVGNLWILDASSDTGEQYSNALWASPDILVDAPPYGSVDVNPVFGRVNHLWTVVHNMSDVAITNARVRYYWTHPNIGYGPGNWQLIAGTASHPNPTNLFTVPANGSTTAPYVEWTPNPMTGAVNPGSQCILAIAFVNDDPKDSTNPDPLVYPFDLPWENNMAVRNVHVVSLQKFKPIKFQVAIGLPFDGIDHLTTDLDVQIAYVPRLPIFGFPPRVIPPQVTVTIGDQPPISLLKTEEAVPVGELQEPEVRPQEIGITPLKVPGPIFTRPTEKIIAEKHVKEIALVAKRPIPLNIELSAPATAQPGTNFLLRLKQIVQGEVTGCYTVVITIV